MTLTEALRLRGQCDKLLDQARSYLHDRNQQHILLALVDDVAELEPAITDERNRAEVTLSRGQVLLEASAFGPADEAFALAQHRFSQVSSSSTERRRADCHIGASRACAGRGQYREAVEHLRRARHLYQEWDPDSSVNYVAEVTTAVAVLLVRLGLFDAAFAELDQFPLPDDDDGVAPTCRVQRALAEAEAHAGQGQYRQAERTIAKLGKIGVTEVDAEIASSTGFVLAKSGQHERASHYYHQAIHSYERALAPSHKDAPSTDRPNSDHSHRDTTINLAAAITNYGAVLGARGEHPTALQQYQRALTLLEQTTVSDDRKAVCHLNIGVEALAADDWETAETHLDAAEKALSAAGLAQLHAGCLVNLGRLHDRRGESARALELHQLARTEFLDLDLNEWAARSGLNIAVSKAEAHTTVRGNLDATDPSQSPLDDLLPALLHLDQMRFQFPTATARLNWKQTVAGANRLAFELAGDDPHLIAGLIENTINSGVHSTEAADTNSPLDLQERLTAPVDIALPDESTTTVDFDLQRHGAGLLIAGAELPMLAPPRMRLPDGSVALERYYLRAQQIYGTETNTRDVVDTAPALPATL